MFSPDGRQIAILLIDPEALTLAVMDTDGSNVRELASFPVVGGSMQHGGSGFAWSPDATTLLVNGGPSGDDLDLYTVARAGHFDEFDDATIVELCHALTD